ncbi:hypothetical protein Q5O24_05265 [Eubacteriaceae bacterium ES3]|nr:hypothetical protein Q5O24_05265 [Eubacteriaceae bacterium ES3]
MGKRKRKTFHERWQEFLEEAKKSKTKTFVYIALRVLVVLVLISSIVNQNYNNAFLCILTLVLFLIPGLIDEKLNIVLPDTLEIIILLFIFSAEILGEINEYYLMYDRWDDMLHTMNGFLCAAIGFSMIDILNRNENVKMYLSPVFVAIVAFCFSMTIGVLWEFYEFGMDYFFLTDMQKDTILPAISSVIFNPDGKNVAVTIQIHEMIVNGVTWNYGGYIDIGLYDTMHDLFVNFIGAVTFSIIGYFYIVNRTDGDDSGKFARRFIPRMKTDEEKNHNE